MAERLSPVEILDRLISFPTVSRDSNLPLIDWVEAYLGTHGIEAHRHWNDARDKAGLFAHVGPLQDGGVVLSGHTDVVPTDGQVWATDPFLLTEKDGRYFGRGTTDMKGFDALAIWALVEARYADLARPLQLALSYDEEIGCTGAPPLITSMAALPKAADVIVGEPTELGVVTGHKGGVTFDVHVHGFEVHSSIMHRGVSAIMWGSKLIEWANRVNVEQESAPPSEMAALFDPPFTNVHVGMIQGGTAHNITAKDCTFSLGFRVVPGESLDHWRSRFLTEVAAQTQAMKAVRPEAWIEATEAFSLPPFAPTALNGAESLARTLTGDNADHFVSYGTEASHFQAVGYDAVVCGPGNIAVAHQPDEYISVAEFQAGQRFMQRLLTSLGRPEQ